MSLPRPVVPGRMHLITRRCTQRTFLMRPDKPTNQAFIYCLALAAERTGVQIMFTLAHSNHHHTGIIDVEGNYPSFLAYFHKLFAKHQNSLRGRWENFWASEQTSVVELVTKDDAFDKMVYSLTNPVKDGLVQRATQWPGVSSLACTLAGKPLTANRPGRFFRKTHSILPASVTLPMAPVPGLDVDTFPQKLAEHVANAEKEAATKLAKDNWRVMGRGNVRKQCWRGQPSSRAPRRGLSPRVACRDKDKRKAAIQRFKAFVASYNSARANMLAGETNAHFPAGTWALSRITGVPLDSLPDPPAAG